MFAYTCFNNMSEFGYKSSILKSGICKYFRRGEKEKFTWCVMEMAKFNDLDEDNKAKKGLITNLINRLKILLMEEISCYEINRIYNGICLLNDYDKNRNDRGLLLEFCDIVCECNRNRATSYVNNWWRNKKFIVEDRIIVKCLKYKKEGDSDKLMILGENLINYIEEKDERMFGIFMEMIKLKDKNGLRYRRRTGDYLWWEIIFDYIKDDSVKEIWNFGLNRYTCKGMKERYYFGVWIGLMVWKNEYLDYLVYCGKKKEYDVDKYYKNMNKLVIDDYVINDFHVNKNYSLKDFALNGAYVKNEDLSILGKNGKVYKDFYIKIKEKIDKSKMIKNVEKNNDDDLEIINWDNFKLIKIIEEGVCCGKVPCIVVDYKGKRYVLKEMKKSMNYGIDYIVVDKCKRLFGLKDMNMKRIKCNKSLVKLDNMNKSYVNNCKIGDKESIYCMMDYWDNIGDLGKNKKILDNEEIVYECLKIRLFDGLFMSSDNNLRNILVNKNGELLSIDEGDLYGKRKTIFNRGDWCVKNMNYELLSICIEEIIWKKEDKKREVFKIMDYYNLNFKKEFCERIDNYKSIVF